MKLFKTGLVRASIPFGIMLILSIVLIHREIEVYHVLFGGLIGIILAGTSVIYDIESEPLKKQSIIHFIIMSATVLPCLALSGWYPLNSISDYMRLIGTFLLTGLILWTIFYFIFTRVIK